MMTMMSSRFFATALLVLVAATCVAGDGTVTCSDPLEATSLSEAMDASIMLLQSEKGWFSGLRTSTGYANALGVFSCTPDDDKWKFPAGDNIKGLLKRVLDSGELKVAGVKWSQPFAADYITDPMNPTGFWPEYLAAIVTKLGDHYGKKIAIKRVYYATSALVNSAVGSSVDVDMSEPYYVLSGFFDEKPRIESMQFSCITAGMPSKFFTLKNSGVTSVAALNTKIDSSDNKAIGFIAKGNYDAISAIISETVTPVFLTNSTQIESNVKSGALVAGYVSEGEPSNPGLFNVFATGIISPRVILFRKDSPVCTSDASTAASDAATVAAAVCAAAALVSVLTVAYLIWREKHGRPLFMPLINHGQEATV